MKINVYFRDKLVGTVESRGEKIFCRGTVKNIIQFYLRQGYKGDALVKLLLERLRGNTWAELVEE